MLKAKKKPLESLSMEDFKEELERIQSVLSVVQIEEPPVREGGIILESVDELIEKLKNVDKVL